VNLNLNVTFPSLLGLEDFSLLVLRLVVAAVFGASGYFHVKDPVGRAKGLEISPTAALGLGIAEVLGSLGLVTGVLIQPAALGLILVGLGAIQKKVFAWKTGIWGKGTDGWHYDLMLLAMDLVIVATAGGRWVVRL
jgi:putative oxidoreductase